MVIYKGHFKNEKYDTDIEIVNNQSFDDISFQLDGVSFSGSFGCFELDDPESQNISQLPFQLLKWGKSAPYYYDLQRYEFEVIIPVTVIRISDERDMSAFINLKYRVIERNEEQRKHCCIIMCDNERVFPDVCVVSEFSLQIGEDKFYGTQSVDFETALTSIIKQIKDKYLMKCCFNCQYSEYSPYGNSEFGGMLCYGKHKKKYLELNEKNKIYSYLCDLGDDFVSETEQGKQEIYVCEDYEPRTLYGGYRGFIY